MNLPDSMYDYRYSRKPAKHTCEYCNDLISEEEFKEYDGCCEFCNRHEKLTHECEECGRLITEAEYYSQDYMCDECYDERNE